MLGLSLIQNPSEPLRILCLGAHCDDIEIGCGGTLLQLLAAHPGSEVLWVVFCSNPVRAREADECAREFLSNAGSSRIVIHSFRDGFLPYDGGRVKDTFESIKSEFNPDIIFTHYLDDRHQDHRLVSDLTWNTWRNHLILEYEIVKYDGDLGSPNVFVSLGEDICAAKIDAVMRCYRSQLGKHWFQPDVFRSIMRIRGVESASKYAESFYSRKLILNAARPAPAASLAFEQSQVIPAK